MNVLYVDTEGSYSYKITGDGIKKYMPNIPGINLKIANHKKTERHHIDNFIPDWCLTSTPLNNHSYVIKQHRRWLSVGWDLEGIYEWKRLRKTDSPNFDLIATVDPLAQELLEDMGRKSVYLPLGFDPDVYKPMKVPKKYQSDVLIAGVMYDNRAKLVRSLRPIGKDVKIRTINCKHWEAKIVECKDFITHYHDDKVGVDDLIKYINGAKIILVGHRDFEPNNDQRSIGIRSHAIGRIFQETACKKMVISDNSRPFLQDHFEYGKEIEVFNDFDELRDKIMHYLKNDDEREKIAQRGYERTMKENTYFHRLQYLYDYVKKEFF